MITKRTRLKVSSFAALLLAAGIVPSRSDAQTAPKPQRDETTAKTPSTASHAGDSDEDSVIVLTPFEVSATRDTGYSAADTLAGTRIRTDLRDVGSAITVITKEFMNDIGATDNETLIQYTPSAEVGGTRSTYTGAGNSQSISENLGSPSANTRIRGLSAADNTRDFFVSDIPWDGFNVDRVDIQRGANSMLFGLGKPAGIINASLSSAEFRNFGKAEIRYGSYGSLRTSLDVNEKIIDKTLAIRIAALRDDKQYMQDPAFEKQVRTYGAIRFDPKLFKNSDFHTSIRGKFEKGKIDADRPRVVTPNDNMSPFFRAASTTNNIWGGLGKSTFDPYFVLNGQNIAGDNKGQATGTDPDFNAWISGNSMIQQQQPFFMVDGATGQTYGAYAGFVNRAVRNSTGGIVASSTIAAIPNSFPFISVNTPQQYATTMKLPYYQYGQYKQSGLQDTSIFDYRHILIDGPNKWEKSHWNSYNIDISETAFHDRIGLDFTYDRQTYWQGSEGLFGTPSLNVDLTARFQDFSANPNAGRAFIVGSGSGSWTQTKRDVARASLFAELRATDLLRPSLLTKILGRHRFNGVYADDTYATENRGYRLFSAAQSWYDYWLGTTGGASAAFDTRAPVTVVYLGPTLSNSATLAGVGLPGVQTNVMPNGAPLTNFLMEWKNFNVPFNAPYDKVNDPVWGQFPSSGTYTQSGNPANYVGWNKDFNLDLVRAADGKVDYNTTTATKTKRKTESYAGTWQSYWWNDALVGTVGWRYDVVKSKNVQGVRVAANHNLMNLSPDIYGLPHDYDPALTLKDHSLGWGGVLHLNRIFKKDFLPINVSLSYNRSSNFEVTTRRVDVYGAPLPNPRGDTKDMGIRLSTKDNRFSVRVTQYKSTVTDATSSGFDTSSLGSIMATGIAWANVFQYDLGGYTMDTAGQNPGRSNYSPGPGETQDDATRRENAAVAAWRELQAKVDPRFYAAWGMDPTQVYQYTSRAPANFTITEDATSKGTEYELVANPTRAWRISANASRTEAISTNVGGASLIDYVNLITHYMNDTPAGDLRQFSGGPTANTFQNIWNSGFMVRWTLKKLTEGSSQPEIRKWRYSATTNYSFLNGRLKGLGVGASYRWEDKVAIGYPVVVTSTTNAIYDLSKPYYGPSDQFLDAWMSYKYKFTKKLTWSVQLNLRNVLGKPGLIPITVQPDGSTWAQVRMKPEREWSLSNSIAF